MKVNKLPVAFSLLLAAAGASGCGIAFKHKTPLVVNPKTGITTVEADTACSYMGDVPTGDSLRISTESGTVRSQGDALNLSVGKHIRIEAIAVNDVEGKQDDELGCNSYRVKVFQDGALAKDVTIHGQEVNNFWPITERVTDNLSPASQKR